MKKHIPNALTCCNLISGCIATAFSLKGDFEDAFIFIIIGAVFDFFDGFVARLLKVSSPIGKEFDSLADSYYISSLTLPFSSLHSQPCASPSLISTKDRPRVSSDCQRLPMPYFGRPLATTMPTTSTYLAQTNG